MLSHPGVRVVFALTAFLSTLAVTPILSILCMGMLSLRYRAWEVPLLGLFMDFLWLPAESTFPFMTLLSIALAWGFEPLRREFLLP
jgi:hypothetical protein